MPPPKAHLAAALAAALAAPALAAPAPNPLSLTVSGGVSLGSYQAGFLYYILAANQQNAGAGPVLKVATGASAGSANALMALRYACGGLPLDPRQSLFARVWLPMGFHELLRRDEVEAEGAFSRSALVRVGALLEEELSAGLPEGCTMALGVAVTRVKPRLRPLAGGRTTIPRTVERFALRVEGRGPGRLPRFTNYLDLDSDDEQPALPEEADGSVAFAHVRDLLIASGAFPVAFPPQPVDHCMRVTRGRKAPYCPASEASRALFLDGGVFDNDPLRFAAHLAAGGLEEGPGGLVLREAGPRARGALPRGVEFAFLSAGAKTYPEPVAGPSETHADSLLSLLAEEGSAFVETARAKELDLLLAEYPEVGEALIYPQRHYPAASEPMLAFFGFFERDFREFDFALGMYEARRHLARFGFPRLERRHPGRAWLYPESTAEAEAAKAGWRPFRCLRAVVDGAGDPAAECAGDDLSQFRAVLQTSLDRLWNDCRAARLPSPESSFRGCAPVLEGSKEPRVPGAGPSPGARRANELSTAYVVRLLAAYGFEWRDMGYGRGSAFEAMVGLRRDLGELGGLLARAQPTLTSRGAVAAATDLAADLLFYLPPSDAVWFLLGPSLEVGGAASLFATGWLGLGGALELQNLFAGLSSDPLPVSLLPVAGLQVAPAALGSALLQGSLLVRGGYVFRLNQGGRCSGAAGTIVGGCSRPEVEAGAAASFAQLLRIQCLAEWYPPARGGPGLWAVVPSMGLQASF